MDIGESGSETSLFNVSSKKSVLESEHNIIDTQEWPRVDSMDWKISTFSQIKQDESVDPNHALNKTYQVFWEKFHNLLTTEKHITNDDAYNSLLTFRGQWWIQSILPVKAKFGVKNLLLYESKSVYMSKGKSSYTQEEYVLFM